MLTCWGMVLCAAALLNFCIHISYLSTLSLHLLPALPLTPFCHKVCRKKAEAPVTNADDLSNLMGNKSLLEGYGEAVYDDEVSSIRCCDACPV